MQTPDANLTGVWQGLYSYPDGESVSFTAVLIETGSNLSGSTHEQCSMPGCPLASHNGFLSGSRHGRNVTFKKTYTPAGYGYETVEYEGTLNADGSEIEGRWRIPMLAGRFLMIRTPAATKEITEEKLEKV